MPISCTAPLLALLLSVLLAGVWLHPQPRRAEGLRRLWQLSPNILIPLDSGLNPVPGTATCGNTLSRTH